MTSLRLHLSVALVMILCTGGLLTVHGEENYHLGPGDVVTVLVPEAEELSNKPIRVNMDGTASFPMAGTMHVAGLNSGQLEVELNKRLGRYLRNPQCVVTITDFRSQPVSVLGSVNAPGVYQVAGRKSLLEMISMAGGLRTDVGSEINVTRRVADGVLPVPGAHLDSSKQFSLAVIGVKQAVNGPQPELNFDVAPFDVISVTRAEVVYAIGSVNKPGSFSLGENKGLSALQVLSLAQGLEKGAAAKQAKILHKTDSQQTSRSEIAVNIQKLMKGQTPDVMLGPDDILFVPSSTAKVVSTRTLEAVVQAATGVAIYRR